MFDKHKKILETFSQTPPPFHKKTPSNSLFPHFFTNPNTFFIKKNSKIISLHTFFIIPNKIYIIPNKKKKKNQ